MKFRPLFVVLSLALVTSGCMSNKNQDDVVKDGQPTAEVGKKSAEALYQEGLANGKNKNYQMAAKLWEQAAEQGNAKAQISLGLLYNQGLGVEQDTLRAVYWFEKAAKQNDAEAQFNLGVIYQKGENIRQDYQRAAQWYEKAAEQGHENAQVNLGFLYVKGLGVPADNQKARLWWGKAAAQGNEDAKNNLQRLKSDS